MPLCAMESHCLSDVSALLADCYDLRTQLAQILHRTVDGHLKPIALDEMHPAMVAVTAKLELHESESDELRKELDEALLQLRAAESVQPSLLVEDCVVGSSSVTNSVACIPLGLS